MKNVLLLAIPLALGCITDVQGQQAASAAAPQPGLMYLYDMQGKPLTEKRVEDVEGSPYLTDEWSWGAVKMRNGRFAKDVSLKFDLYGNRLFFQRDNVQFEFVGIVQEFMLGIKNAGDSQALLYRNGYPAIDKNGTETFYEVLADGKVQLLNYKYKYIEEYRPYNEPPRKKFTYKEQLYISMPGNKIVKIRKDKDDLIKNMPEYADAINKIVSEKKLKIKKEEDVVQLVMALNQSFPAN